MEFFVKNHVQVDRSESRPLSTLRRTVWVHFCMFFAFLGILTSVGCDSPKTKPVVKANGAPTGASSPVPGGGHKPHGPKGEHGGDILHLNDAHAEWSHDEESGKVTVYLEEIVAGGAKIDKVQMNVKVQGNAAKSYEFISTGADEHKIEGAVFSITSKELLNALEVGQGVEAELVVRVNGKDQSCKIEHHDH